MEPKRRRALVPPHIRAEKLISRNPGTGCWDWTGYVNNQGYGQFTLSGRHNVRAHRFTYEYYVGPIPEDRSLDHLCRNRACVNPEHLEPVTTRVNTLRGIGFAAQNARKTHCKWGHEFTPENTYSPPGKGGRYCATCKAQTTTRWNARTQANIVARRERGEAA